MKKPCSHGTRWSQVSQQNVLHIFCFCFGMVQPWAQKLGPLIGGVGSISGPGPRARAGMGPVRGPAWSPQSPRARASMGSPRARAGPQSPRARRAAGSAGFNLFRPTSFKVFCRNPACSRKTTAYYNPILFHATAKYYSILVYTTTVPDHTRKFFSVLQSNTPYYNCTTP